MPLLLGARLAGSTDALLRGRSLRCLGGGSQGPGHPDAAGSWGVGNRAGSWTEDNEPRARGDGELRLSSLVKVSSFAAVV